MFLKVLEIAQLSFIIPPFFWDTMYFVCLALSFVDNDCTLRWLSVDDLDSIGVSSYGSQELELKSYFSWTSGGSSAQIIFSSRQFLYSILILLPKLSNKNIKKELQRIFQVFSLIWLLSFYSTFFQPWCSQQQTRRMLH